MTDDTMVTFGKHSGLTYAEVWRDHRSYAEWAMGVQDPGGPLSELVDYFVQKTNEERADTASMSGKRTRQVFDDECGPEDDYYSGGLEAFIDRYVKENEEVHGQSDGTCFDWLSHGVCDFRNHGECEYKHPRLTVRRRASGGVQVTMDKPCRKWVKALRVLGFSYDRHASTDTCVKNVHDHMSVRETVRALRADAGVLSRHIAHQDIECDE